MSRAKNTKILIEYLKKYINCDNIEKFIQKHTDDEFINASSCYMDTQLIIKNIPVSCKIIQYSDDTAEDNNDIINRNQIDTIFKYFDFITESNHTGFEHFPYLYGVLDCRNNENSKVYLLFENFQGNLIHLINSIEHPSEWYDIAFQIVMINYFTFDLNKYRYPNGSMYNHLYNKLPKPYYQDYELDGIKFNVSHKYLIVMWNLKLSIDVENNKCSDKDDGELMINGFGDDSNLSFKTNIEYLLQYVSENDNKVKIKPSPRITSFLKGVAENPSNTVKLIIEYYGSK